MNEPPEPEPPATSSRQLSRPLVVGTGVLLVVALLGGIVTESIGFTGSAALHLQIEYFAVFVAVSIFFLSSAKYAVSRTRAYLPLAIGFFAAGIFDLVHPIAYSGTLPVATVSDLFYLRDPEGYLWWLGRIAYGAGLLATAVAYSKRRTDDAPNRLLIRALVWTFLEIVVLGTLVILLPLPPYYGPNGIGQYLELLPMIPLAAAAWILVRRPPRTDRALVAGSLASLGFAGLTQAFAALSRDSSDALFFLAHAAKVASYLVVLFALFIEHIQLYEREHEMRRSVEVAEKRANQSRTELFQIIQHIADGVVITEAQGLILHANRAALDLLGVADVSDMVGKPLQSLAGRPGVVGGPDLVTALESARATGKEWRGVEFQLPGPDDRAVDLSVGIAVLREPEGRIQGLVVSFHDETRLRRAERRYREVTENAPDGIIEMDEAGAIVFFNAAAERIFGYAKEEVLGRDVTVLMPERMRKSHTEARRRFFETGVPRFLGRPLNLPGLRKDAREIALELTLASGGAGRRRVTGVVRDVQLLQRSRREREGLLAVLEAVNASADVSGLCRIAGRRICEALEYEGFLILVQEPGEKAMKPLGAGGAFAGAESLPEVPITAASRPLSLRTFRDARSLSAVGSDVLRAASAPVGEALGRTALLVCVPIRIAENVVGVLEAVTTHGRHAVDEEVPILEAVAGQFALALSQKRLIRELEETARSLASANQELDAFVYTASHDLAEPLRSMSNFSQFLIEDFGPRMEPEAQNYVKRIHDGALRMRSLLDALLRISRLRHEPIPFERVEARAVLEEVREALDAMIRDRSAELQIHDPIPAVWAQRTRLLEVFNNLVTNGLKFNEASRPTVDVSAVPREGLVEFRFKDNGIGIPSRHRDKVFGLFTRLHPQGKYPGTGAGLAIVRKIVEQHGGTIWIESEEGRGTTVHFTLAKPPK